jgi:hypothetical protein
MGQRLSSHWYIFSGDDWPNGISRRHIFCGQDHYDRSGRSVMFCSPTFSMARTATVAELGRDEDGSRRSGDFGRLEINAGENPPH